MEKADVKNKWESSSWGRKLIVQKRRASLNDFDRFKLMLAKIKRSGVIKQELAKLKKGECILNLILNHGFLLVFVIKHSAGCSFL
ncbi:hypothetical protein ES332_D02G222000v1 [Gossypium tomentosum]|uniref:Large ribosomal subunit protein eL14 domain-containing protein n=1 Tax=Gossypium tomentosum TaxID=34277 RepID=A0A5D2M0F6_GOSTO|nr:hypothetical protein ES332_D02G222000v1 [Gossypium tomentosum]